MKGVTWLSLDDTTPTNCEKNEQKKCVGYHIPVHLSGIKFGIRVAVKRVQMRPLKWYHTIFTWLNTQGVYLNLASWTRRLFDTQTLLELFIHEAMAFFH